MNINLRRVTAFSAVLLALTLLLSGCEKETRVISDADEFTLAYDTSRNIYFEIEFEDGNVLEGELYPKTAPITVRNFVTLAESGFYNGKTISRTVKDILIQGGTSSEDPPYYIRGEFAKNGWNNTLKHTRGVISMARRNDYDTAYSTFFICLETRSSFNDEYAAFGKITSGMPYADQYAALDDGNEHPSEEIKIKEIRILGN